MSDPYENKAGLGAMVRRAAQEATHDEKRIPDLKRLNDIQVGTAFVNALVDSGCMITRMPEGNSHA